MPCQQACDCLTLTYFWSFTCILLWYHWTWSHGMFSTFPWCNIKLSTSYIMRTNADLIRACLHSNIQQACMPFFISLREHDDAIWEIRMACQTCCCLDLLVIDMEGLHTWKKTQVIEDDMQQMEHLRWVTSLHTEGDEMAWRAAACAQMHDTDLSMLVSLASLQKLLQWGLECCEACCSMGGTMLDSSDLWIYLSEHLFTIQVHCYMVIQFGNGCHHDCLAKMYSIR